MSRPLRVQARCVGNPSFRPEDIAKNQDRLKQARDLLCKNDLHQASRMLLGLPEPDVYTYHAIASVKLAEAQHVVDRGGDNGLHGWYKAEDGSTVRFCTNFTPPFLKHWPYTHMDTEQNKKKQGAD